MPHHNNHTGWILIAAVLMAGCQTTNLSTEHPPLPGYQPQLQSVEIPALGPDEMSVPAAESLQRPPSVRTIAEAELWPLTLEEAIHRALTDSETIRQLGGRIVSTPNQSATVFDPAILETDPRAGVEAALSAFDTQFNTSMIADRAENRYNNRIRGEGALQLHENRTLFEMGLTKVAATGTAFTVNHLTRYRRNNAPANVFSSVYEPVIEMGFRHPLMQGGGVDFNRIAGPRATPGLYRGVVIARINGDIALADFEASVRTLVRDVERTYWELHFAYRDLDAKRKGRENARETWEQVKLRVEARDLPPDQEAFARTQFYGAQAAVENSLSNGVLRAENQLRALIGLPTSDGRVIRPSTHPVTADVQFSWEESLADSVFRRVELRRQRWKVKQRQLELQASENFTKPEIDLIGSYHWNGFGDHYFGATNGAIENLFEAQLEGWRLGVEVKTPIGNRAGHAARRNAELLLRRERAILEEQERQILAELRDAFTELDRAYAACHSNYNRYVAAKFREDAQRRRNAEGAARLDQVLDSEVRTVEAEIAYHRAVVDYNLALSNVHYVRGTLMDSLQVFLSEGPWSAEAHASADRQRLRFEQDLFRYEHSQPSQFSLGEYPQAASQNAVGDDFGNGELPPALPPLPEDYPSDTPMKISPVPSATETQPYDPPITAPPAIPPSSEQIGPTKEPLTPSLDSTLHVAPSTRTVTQQASPSRIEQVSAEFPQPTDPVHLSVPRPEPRRTSSPSVHPVPRRLTFPDDTSRESPARSTSADNLN